MRHWWKRFGAKRDSTLLKLGPRSKLVLAKLGFDMRASYDGLIHEPLPERHASLLKQLPGQHDVIDLDSERESPARRPSEPIP